MSYFIQKLIYLLLFLLLLNGCNNHTDQYPPNALNDTYMINENTPLTANAADNDTPGSSGNNYWHTLTDPLHGSVTMDENGSFSYIPDTNYYGTDSFLYAISDEFGQSDNATVTLNIKPVLFRIKVKTDNQGFSSDVEFLIAVLNDGYNYDYDIDCNNDGKYESTNGDGNYTCEYDTPGEYTIAIGGTFPQFHSGYDADKILSVESWGTQVWKSFEDAFYYCNNLTLNAPDKPNLSQVKSMSGMFAYATTFNQSIEDWNVSNVIEMNKIFFNASSFNQPIGDWNVSNVTNMNDMFYGATAFNQPIGNWNVSNVTSMNGMFCTAGSFNQPIGDWNISNVIEMNEMFVKAVAFNQPIGDWNVSATKYMERTFAYATAFNQPLEKWDVSNVITMEGMFYGAAVFNQPIGNWNVSAVQDMIGMFDNATIFNQPIGNWNVSAVQDMSLMFYRATAFNQSLENWDVSSVQYMNSMFYNASAFSDHNLSGWNVDNVFDHTDFCTGWGTGNTPPSDWTCN